MGPRSPGQPARAGSGWPEAIAPKAPLTPTRSDSLRVKRRIRPTHCSRNPSSLGIADLRADCSLSCAVAFRLTYCGPGTLRRHIRRSPGPPGAPVSGAKIVAHQERAARAEDAHERSGPLPPRRSPSQGLRGTGRGRRLTFGRCDATEAARWARGLSEIKDVYRLAAYRTRIFSNPQWKTY